MKYSAPIKPATMAPKRRRSFNPSRIFRRHTGGAGGAGGDENSTTSSLDALGSTLGSGEYDHDVDVVQNPPPQVQAHPHAIATGAAAAQDSSTRVPGGLTERRIESLGRTQEATLQALAELRGAVQELTGAVSESRARGLVPPRSRSVIDRPVSFDIPPSVQEETSVSATAPEDDEGMDRKQARLDGLEVYAVVSAVTAGTLVAVFDSYQPGDVVDLFHEGRYLEVLMSVAFLIIGSIGIVCGLHCIFVFSLITMYGRTALGMERDDALETFFAGTGMQRYRGFQSFVRSLYALMGELIVVITAKVSSRPSIHLVGLCATMTLMYYVYRDTQVIMDKAGVIFAPLAPTKIKKKRSSLDLSAREDIEEQEGDGAAHEEKKVDGTIAAPPRPVSRGLQKGRSSFNVAATELVDMPDPSPSSSLRRRDTHPMARSSLSVAATDLLKSSGPSSSLTTRPPVRTRLQRGQSSFNVAATELMDASQQKSQSVADTHND